MQSFDYAIKEDDDWTNLLAVIYHKMKKMAHYAIKEVHHENKEYVREIWRASRPIKRALNERTCWPYDILTTWEDGIVIPVMDNGKNIWITSDGRDTGVRCNGSHADAEKEFFKNQMNEFAKLMGETCRHWWW